MRPPRRDAVPRSGLGERGRVDGDEDRRHDACRMHGDTRGTTMEPQRLPRAGPRALREHDERLALLERGGGPLDHEVRGMIGNISGATDGQRHRRVAPQGALHDAVRARNEGQQEDDVDQRRMVGDDQLPRPAQSVEAAKLVGQHAEDAHETHEAAKGEPHQPAHAVAAASGRARQEQEERHDGNAQHESAQAEQGEAESGTRQSPDERVAATRRRRSAAHRLLHAPALRAPPPAGKPFGV